MILALLRRWADTNARKRIADLETELDSTSRRLAVAEAEAESMALVIARDRARVEAETAAYSRQRADAEGRATDGRTDASLRDFES